MNENNTHEHIGKTPTKTAGPTILQTPHPQPVFYLQFLEDMFAQHLIHKTVFAIAAWSIYAGLLWGRHFRGWRGNKAIRWTLAGFISLMLAYFGTKIVLEVILHRV